MKLKSCHINGFGIYKNKDFDFSLLSQYVSLNGSGKSTLADFIKFMLYDLPKKDERLKYAPYDNGAFGGSLVLEFEGKEYRIEKEFDVKSQAKDQERVYINNSLSDIKSLGNYLFKVDLEGFTRTIFINGNDLSISSNSTINSKLNSLVSKTEDDFDLKKVLDNLHEAKKLYSTNAKATSLLVAAKKELDQKQNEYDELKKLDEALESSYKELKDKDNELNNLNEKINKLEKENEKASIYDEYEFKKNHIDNLLNDSLSIRNKYPKLLNEEEINDIKNDLKAYNELKLLINRNDFNNPELLKLKESFDKNPIEEKDIIEIEEKIRKIDELKLLLKKNDQVIIKDEDLHRFEGVDVEKEIKDASNELNNYNELNERIVQSREIKETKKLNYLLIPSIIFFIVFVLGVSLLFIEQIIIGSVLMGIGLILGVIFLLLALKPKKNNNLNNEDLYFKYRQSEKKLTDILARYRYDDLSYEAKLIHLKNDYEKYKADKEKNNKLDLETKYLEDEVKNLKVQVEEFINKYLLTYSEYYEAIRIISNRLSRYNQYVNEKEVYEKNNLENNNKLKELEEKLKAFSKEFNISFESINSFIDNISIDLKNYKYILNNIENSKNELDKFIKDNNINLEEKFEKIDLSGLKEEKENLTKAHNYLDKNIKDNEALLERLSYLEAECNSLKDKIEEYKHKAKVYESVTNYLEDADNSLKEKYIKPLKDKFIGYASKLDSIFKEDITFDNDFNLKLIREGHLVDDYHLSQGEKTVAMLCYRLALIDNMYNDKPFIILDDPFVNLDQNNLKVALKLVKELSKETQIIYFTCIDTRKV